MFCRRSKTGAPKGLDSSTAQAFTDFLRILFTESRDFWEPSFCEYIPNFLPLAQKTAGKNFPQPVTAKIQKYVFWEETKEKNEDKHIWMCLCFENEQIAIVDPTGLNVTTKIDQAFFIPYFGLIKYAPETSIGIYRKGKDVPIYKGYIVEEKLRQFRRHEIGGKWNQYISFDSPEGKALLAEYRKVRIAAIL